MFGYAVMFAVGVYYAPDVRKAVKKARRKIYQNYGI